jgi:hypothetical protein
VWTVAGTGASDGLGEDFFCLLRGAGFTAAIHISETLRQLLDERPSRLSIAAFWSGERSLALRSPLAWSCDRRTRYTREKEVVAMTRAKTQPNTRTLSAI